MTHGVTTSFLLCVCLAATTATAQDGITTSVVKVDVTGKRCGELNNVYLVINGNDREDRWVKLDPVKLDREKETCHWTTDLHDHSISTSIARFSLRSGPRRTGCQMAKPVEADTPFANLVFSCCADESPFRNLSVKIEPAMPVSYVRDVRPLDEDQVRCFETATFNLGRGTIDNAQFEREDVSLQLGALKPKPKMPGLIINKIVADDDTLVLTLDGMTLRLMVQRAKGKMRSAPGLSSNAITLDIKQLSDLKFKQAEFKVIK